MPYQSHAPSIQQWKTNFIKKTQLTATKRSRNRGLGTSHKNYFACVGRGKMEGVRGCEIIHDADEGNITRFDCKNGVLSEPLRFEEKVIIIQ